MCALLEGNFPWKHTLDSLNLVHYYKTITTINTSTKIKVYSVLCSVTGHTQVFLPSFALPFFFFFSGYETGFLYGVL